MSYTQSSLVDLLESSGISAKESSSNSEVTICCPYCMDSKYHLYMNPDKEVFICFRCNTKGGFSKILPDLGIKGAVTLSLGQLEDRIIKAKALRELRSGHSLPLRLAPSKLPPQYILLGRGLNSVFAKQAKMWLFRRGLNWSDIRRWELGFCSSGKYGGCLIFPVRDQSQNVVTFQARKILGTPLMKTENPPSPVGTVSKADSLYGIHLARPRCFLVLVEGPLDVIALYRSFRALSFPAYPLGLFGHSMSRVQMQMVRSLHPVITWVMLDADAREEGRKLGQELATWMEGEVRVTDLEYGDPDDIKENKIVRILAESSRAKPRKNMPIRSRKMQSRDA